MATIGSGTPRAANVASNSQISPIPRLGEGFHESSTPISRQSGSRDGDEKVTGTSEGTAKHGKRRLWGLGKRRDAKDAKEKNGKHDKHEKNKSPSPGGQVRKVTLAQARSMSPPSPPSAQISPRVSMSQRRCHPPSSPGRNRPSSHVVSPASSQIFERDVQEDVSAPQKSPAIPSHIITENHIPPVLEASSEALTNRELDPDHVEIVMHSAHQPAAASVAGMVHSEATSPILADEPPPASPHGSEAAESFGGLEGSDVRRLSFVSFADVVHSETAEHSTVIAGAPPVSARATSPARSLSAFLPEQGNSPLSSVSASFSAHETSPSRDGRLPASPRSPHSPSVTSELTVETMRQALRKTGSRDFGSIRSQPLSAVGEDDRLSEQHVGR